jgi:Ohr subfamily peroxiredoxin
VLLGALKAVAGKQKMQVPADTKIDAEVAIGPIPAGFGLQVSLAVSLPGMDKAEAEKLVQAAHQVCPYSNATRGNIEVDLKVV